MNRERHNTGSDFWAGLEHALVLLPRRQLLSGFDKIEAVKLKSKEMVARGLYFN